MVETVGRGAASGIRICARRITVGATLGFYTLAAPFGWAIASLLGHLWRGDEIVRARRMQRLTAGAYRLMHHWLRIAKLVDFDHRIELSGFPKGPCVVVANHPTLIDTTAISAVLGGGFTIVKPGLHRRRLLRPFMESTGHVAAASADPMSAGRVVDECVRRIEQGFVAIVFPEGTRSRPGRLNPFGRTAFEIACRARVPVVSLTIECRPMYLSKEVTALHPPDPTPRFRVAVLAVDDPEDSDCDSRALLRLVEERYGRWHAGVLLAASAAPAYATPFPAPIPAVERR